jgi:aminoglycoside phosphotransferase (APT) family kinase protein
VRDLIEAGPTAFARPRHAVEREYRLLAALHPTGFPVPRPLTLCEDADVIGAPFYVMERVEGRIFWDGTLPEVRKGERRAIYEAMIDTLAALHALDPEKSGLGDFGRAGNYFARQVDRWTRQYRAAQTDLIAEVEKLIEWLSRTIPPQGRTSIIHGDYRIDNLVYAASSPRVRAVLDWELATLGDPLADFSYLAMNWTLARDGRSRLAGIDLAAEGLPTLDEATARCCAATGRDRLPDLNWYFAFNLFRLVGIIQGVKKRVADGNASSADAASAVARIVPWREQRGSRRAGLARGIERTAQWSASL